MSILSPILNALPSAMNSNPLAQRALAQSGNAAYAGRGVYRVMETEPERKGDYWFRDFGMVGACTYMTEAGFRAVERFYTMPLLTNALELHGLNSRNGNGQKRAIPTYQTVLDKQGNEIGQLQKLYSTHLYSQAMNYSEMPDALRQKMMGTLVRNSSDVVGQVLQQDALKQIETLKKQAGDKGVQSGPWSSLPEDLESFIKQPLNPANEKAFENYIKASGLNEKQLDGLRAIAKADNQFVQQDKLEKFLKENPALQKEDMQNTLQVIQNRQMGYLINHLDRTLNFQHYVESNYLKPRVVSPAAAPFEMPAALRRKNQYSQISELGEVISEKLTEYSGKLHALQNSAKGDLSKVAFEVRKLPLSQRKEAFEAMIRKVDDLQLLSKKESLIDFKTSVEKAEGKEGQDVYKSLWEYTNNINRQTSGKASDQLHKAGINWQNDYYNKRAHLLDHLLSQEKIEKKGLEKELEHFTGFFEQMKTKLEIRNYQLEKLWHQLGTDLLVNVKKKIKDAAQELSKIPDDHLPELASSIAARAKVQNPDQKPPKVRATRADVMEARLREIGLDQWDVLTTGKNKNFIRKLAESLVDPLDNRSLEHYANESVMDKVKKEIFGQLTAYNKTDSKNVTKGALFKMLCGEDDEIAALKGSKAFKNTKGLEKLLAPLLKLENLHLAEVLNGDGVKETVRSTEWTMKSLILDGVQSKQVKSAVDKIQRNGTWPKMAATVALNFIFYGWLASRFDNKVLQPYEEKLVARKGTSQDIVTAGYLGTLPAVAVLTQLFDKTTVLPSLKKLNHFNRFTAVGGLALGAFAGSSYGFLKLRDKETPKPTHSASGSAVTPAFKSATVDAFKPRSSATASPAFSNPSPTFGNPAWSNRLPVSQPFPAATAFHSASSFNRPIPQAVFQPFKSSVVQA